MAADGFADAAAQDCLRVAMPKGMTASELQMMEFPSPIWIVDGLIPTGLSLLAGKPKMGKSWLMLDTARAVAGGGEILGRVCAMGDVLYASLEDPLRRLQQRLKKLAPGRWPERLTIWSQMAALEDGGLEQLRAWAHSKPEPRLIIIDVFVKVRRQRGSDDVYDGDYRAASPLKALADELGIAIVVVHHLRKMQYEVDPLDAVSGSTGLTGAVDTVLILNRRASGTTLYCRGRDVEDVEEGVSLDHGTGRWTKLGPSSQVTISPERSAVIEALRKHGPIGPKQIAQVTGRESGAIRRLLDSMGKDGQVRKLARGKYELPLEGEHQEQGNETG